MIGHHAACTSTAPIAHSPYSARTRYTQHVHRCWALAVSAIAISAVSGTAEAGPKPPTIVAIARAADARNAVPIGPAGQVYEPDGKGAWVRRRAGGTAAELVHATSIGSTVIAGAKGGPPFRLKNGAWTAIVLFPKAKAIVGTGGRVVTAANKQVFSIDTTAAQPTKLGDAPAKVTGLAAGKARVLVMTDKGLFELPGGKPGAFKALKKAPKNIRALVSDRWALGDKGPVDLKTMKTIAWPAGMRVDEVTVAGEMVVAVAVVGKGRELVTLAPTAGAKFVREAMPLEPSAVIAGIAADEGKRVVVATRDGKLAVRASGAWVVTEVRDELPPDKPPGPAPALSPAIVGSASQGGGAATSASR